MQNKNTSTKLYIPEEFFNALERQNDRFVSALEEIAKSSKGMENSMHEIKESVNDTNRLHTANQSQWTTEIRLLRSVNDSTNKLIKWVMLSVFSVVLLLIITLIVIAGANEAVKLWSDSMELLPIR